MVQQSESHKQIGQQSESNEQLILSIEALQSTIQQLHEINKQLQEELDTLHQQIQLKTETQIDDPSLMPPADSTEKEHFYIDLPEEDNIPLENHISHSDPLFKEESGAIPNQAADTTTISPLPEDSAFTKPSSADIKIQELEAYLPNPMKKELPINVIDYKLNDSERQCSYCHQRLIDLGPSSVGIHDEIIFIPARLEHTYHQPHHYQCPQCAYGHESFDLVYFSGRHSEIPQPIIPNTPCSPSLLAEIIRLRFFQFVPYKLQESYWDSLGFQLRSKTMNSWVNTATEKYLSPLYQIIYQSVLKEDVLQAASTSYRNHRSRDPLYHRYWALCTPAHSNKAMVAYHYDNLDDHTPSFDWLPYYKGYLQFCDFDVTQSADELLLVGCLTHIKSKFLKVKGNQRNQRKAAEALDFCTQMFEIEQEAEKKHLRSEAKLAYRETKLRPVFEAFNEWLQSGFYLPKTLLGDAVSYAKITLPTLEALFKNSQIGLTNRIAQLEIHPFALGPRNGLASKSSAIAKTNIIIMTILSTARANRIDPIKYLTFLFEFLPNLSKFEPEILQECMPWEATIQEFCRSKSN